MEMKIVRPKIRCRPAPLVHCGLTLPDDVQAVLIGVIAGNRSGRFTNGRWIMTSLLISPLGRIAEGAIARTVNSRYLLGEPLEHESIAPRIDKKKHPMRSDAGAILASAAKFELMLPHDAPQEYMSLDHLVRRYAETLPAHEINAYAQVTIRFPDAVNLHQPYEIVREWVRAQYPHVPVIVVLHAPHEWGSANAGHVHCIVFPRRLGSLGWAAVERPIGSDIGQCEAYDSWTAFKDQWPVNGGPGER